MTQPYLFYNISKRDMTFEVVFDHIVSFMKVDPRSFYNLSIGSDSQVHTDETLFTTAIHIHRVGKGAWGCLRDYRVPREMKSLHEKISMETSLSQEIAFLFTPNHLSLLSNILIPYLDNGADFNFEIHLDIGKKGLTKSLIQEMTGRIHAMGLEAKIKPDSYTASSYANRYTK
jgi:predicted RNase H-related nuclease YkuK (DUF458 family)